MKTKLTRLVSSAVFVAAVALAVRFAVLWWTWYRATPAAHGERYGYELGCVAKSIASGKGFSSPLPFFDTGPTAWLSPVFPYVVAGIFKIWGIYSVKSHVAIQILNCIFSALTIFPVYAIAKRSFGADVAAAASWLWVVLPDATHIPIADLWEASLAALFLALLFWATLRMRGERSSAKWAGYGALWAVGALINTSLIAVLPLFLAWLAWEARKERLAWPQPVAIASLVFVLGMMPWTVRNYRALGKLVPVRSNFGLEFWLGNNPHALEVNAFQLHPLVDRSEAEDYRSMGEIGYMHAKQSAALAFIRANPGTTAYFVLRRIGDNWFAVSDRVGSVLSNGSLYLKGYFFFNAAMTLLAWFGAAMAWRARNLHRAPYMFVLVAYPLVFYVTHALVRYRFPIEPIVAILAVHGLFRIAHARRESGGGSGRTVERSYGLLLG
ncbi:MAG TPA: glycosyltransferase family 39 protein [Candidatus Acidoferrales bacterium]|nr:glycosyltransferase family 39 protein [Candidatus Acidoferrales bacterium]